MYNLRRQKDLTPAKETEQQPAGRWTDQEQRLFEEAYQMYGKDWKKIKKHVGTRTGVQIRSHGQKYVKRLEQ